jgi:hypothetical protein
MPLERSDKNLQRIEKRIFNTGSIRLGGFQKKETPFTFRIRDCSGILRRRYSGKHGPKGMPLFLIKIRGRMDWKISAFEPTIGC